MKNIFLTTLLLLLLRAGFAQTSIGITAITNTPQTAAYQDSLVYSVAVKNFGPNVYNGGITINVGIWDSSMTYVGIIHSDSSSLLNVMNFNPGDSIWVSETEHFIPQNFRIGTSVVVIWPVAGNALTVDSISYSIVIQSGVKVVEVTDDQPLSLYPNPVNDRITISGGKDKGVEQVRIRNASGQMLLGRFGTGCIDISTLSPGMYFVEIVLTDGSTKIYRVIKQ